MTDQNSELDLDGKESIGLPSTAVLGEWADRVLTKEGDNDGIAFQLLLDNGEAKLFTRDNILGKRLYTDHEILNITQRYEAMIIFLNTMINQGFTIVQLEIAAKEGLAGTKIKFLTPAGRQFEHQYFRDDVRTEEQNLGSNLIPDDFLYDLKMFPSRHS